LTPAWIRRGNHNRNENIGRRRRQAGTKDCAEKESHQNHGGEIDARRFKQQRAQLGGYAGAITKDPSVIKDINTDIFYRNACFQIKTRPKTERTWEASP
jgi:hypothetical protein